MAITGHRTSKQVSRYTQAANQIRLGEAAISKVVAEENKNGSVPHSAADVPSGTLLASKSLK